MRSAMDLDVRGIVESVYDDMSFVVKVGSGRKLIMAKFHLVKGWIDVSAAQTNLSLDTAESSVETFLERSGFSTQLKGISSGKHQGSTL